MDPMKKRSKCGNVHHFGEFQSHFTVISRKSIAEFDVLPQKILSRTCITRQQKSKIWWNTCNMTWYILPIICICSVSNSEMAAVLFISWSEIFISIFSFHFLRILNPSYISFDSVFMSKGSLLDIELLLKCRSKYLKRFADLLTSKFSHELNCFFLMHYFLYSTNQPVFSTLKFLVLLIFES